MLNEGASMYASEIAPSQSVLSERPIRVMVVDDSAVVRGLVSRWIEEEPGLEVVARHANGKLAVEDVVRSAPDIVLLDIEMPVMDGLEALPLLLKARPGMRVLMVSTLTQRNAEISFKALALGAIDYVPKPDSNREITIQPDFRREVIEKIKVLGPLSLRRKGADVPGFGHGSAAEGGEKSRCFPSARLLLGAAARNCDRQLDRRPAGPGQSARRAFTRLSPAWRCWWRNTCRRCSPRCSPSGWRGRPGVKRVRAGMASG